VASAAIDVSDGLRGDLGHVLRASGVGVRLDTDRLLTLLAHGRHADDVPLAPDTRLACVMAGGDDYELAFTAPASARSAVAAAAGISGTTVTLVGCIEAAPGVRLVDAQGRPMPDNYRSFDHFAMQGDPLA
jgi:thiamine-monophosphate kinase